MTFFSIVNTLKLVYDNKYTYIIAFSMDFFKSFEEKVVKNFAFMTIFSFFIKIIAILISLCYTKRNPNTNARYVFCEKRFKGKRENGAFAPRCHAAPATVRTFAFVHC